MSDTASADPMLVFLRSLDDSQRAYLLGYLVSVAGLEEAQRIILAERATPPPTLRTRV